MYGGACTSGESEGIYRCRLNPDTGALDMVGLAAPSEDSSFLALHPRQALDPGVAVTGQARRVRTSPLTGRITETQAFARPECIEADERE